MTTLLERTEAAAGAPLTQAPPPLALITPWRLLGLLAGLAVLVRSIAPFQDIDLYWHVVLGREIATRHVVAGTGAGWSFTTPHSDWVTTQWLSEVVLARIHDTVGWAGIASLKVLVSLVVAVSLGALLLRRHRSWAAPVVYAVTLTVVSAVFQERPQLFSLVLLVWLATLGYRLLRGERGVHPVVLLLVTAGWANLHGLWVMVPAVLGLVALGRLLDGRPRAAVRPALLVLGTTAAACLTPVGPRLLLTPFTFAASTKQIQEWQPTSFHNPIAMAFGVLVALVLVAWARSRCAVPASELVYVGGLTAFSLMALRNIPVAALLLAPVVLARLEATFPHADRVDSAAERRLLRLAVALSLAVAALLAAARVGQPLIPASVPAALAQQLARQPGTHRVLDDYNASGAIVLWGGPRTQVAVDGRADRYGARFLGRYADLMSLSHDWAVTLAQLNPNYALLRRDAQLTAELRREGWTQLGAEGKYVLLRR